jgi:GT2 family glycosyltransferase
MNPVIIIPTYVGNRRKTMSYNVVATYDHTTPMTHQGELPRCLSSLIESGVDVPVILLVVAEQGVEREASEKIQEIAQAYPELDITLVDSQKLAHFYSRADELGLAAIKEGVSLTGYGAIRNLGLVIASILGYVEIIFIEDDETIADEDFIEKAIYGLGKLTQKGIPVLVKTGYYTDRRGKYFSNQKNAWYNRFWQQGDLFNEWMRKAMCGPRLSRSNAAYGGLLAIHREAAKRVSFDPWIARGEDLDYMLNVRMYGGDVWFDNQWSIQHLPPTERTESQRFRQDIYRWIYEQRKLEFSRSQIDLLPIQPHTLYPYPGPFLEQSVSRRVFLTALLRSIGRQGERKGYFRAAMAAWREAKAYTEVFCPKYFEFQLGWPQVIALLENDLELRELFGGRRAIGVGEADERDAAIGAAAVPFDLEVGRAVTSELRDQAVRISAGEAPAVQSTPDLLDFELDIDALGLDDR